MTQLLIDAHVHLHPCYDLAAFLAGLYRNFDQQSQRFKTPTQWVVLLTEMAGVNEFNRLIAERDRINARLTDWTLHPPVDDATLRFTHSNGQSLLIMAGRQLVTQEKIEVLALITSTQLSDGLPLSDTLAAVHAADGLAVLPWGVGKWIGERGTLVADQLKSARLPLFVGDNGGRPSFWSLPSFCSSRPCLPGTDPLPFDHEVNRPGSFGFSLKADLDPSQPSRSLRQALLAPQCPIKPFGQLQSPVRFLRNQLQLRLA